MKKIESSSNEQFKVLKSLLSSKAIRNEQKYLVFGEKAILRLLQKNPASIEQIIFCHKNNSHPLLAQIRSTLSASSHTSQQTHLTSKPTPSSASASASASTSATARELELSPALFEELNPFGLSEPILLARTPQILPVTFDTATFLSSQSNTNTQSSTTSSPATTNTLPISKFDGLTLVLPLGDPANLGALLRSAVAFGVKRVVLLREATHPFHPKAIRAGSGAQFDLEFFLGPSLTELAEIYSTHTATFSPAAITPSLTPLITLDMGGTPINHFTWPKQALLLVGEEGPGLPASLRKSTDYSTANSIANSTANSQIQVISIPKADAIESLNAMVAASIALSHSYSSK